MLRHRSLNLKKLFVHGVLVLAMPAGTPRQQARNCSLEQRGSPDLKQRVSLNIEQRVSLDLKRGVLPVLNSGVRSILNRGFLSILNSGFGPILNSGFLPILNSGFLSILNAGFSLSIAPKIFPEFLPSAGSRWILIPPRGMSCLPPDEGAGSNSLSELLTEGLPNPAEVLPAL